MGASFTNLHIPSGSSPKKISTTLARAMTDELMASGLVAADDPSSSERVVVLLDGAGWVSAYADDDAAGQPLALSNAIQGTVLSFRVTDSDHFELGLFEFGNRTLHLIKRNHLPAKVTPAALTPLKRFLTPGATLGQVAAVLKARTALVDETVAELSELIGLDPMRAVFDAGLARQEKKARVLGFRSVRKGGVFELGLPVISSGGFSPLDGSVGTTIEIGCSGRTIGGASTGLDVVLSGPAIVQKMLQPKTLSLWLSGRLIEGSKLVARNSANGARELVARFPTARIPAARRRDCPSPMSGQEAEMMRTYFRVFAEARLVVAGAATLSISFVPVENPTGAFTETLQLNVAPRAADSF